ncbi:acetyltransferase, including N-acetylases of ribosomal proteins [Clostridium pasteurianum DSM 525 = ATCC 6013]|uniref:Acetyltransferase, including N-acetylases of ribosomal proteins n=1 Tax=Clostridium pasteurianum DSM 525 = ATCC 6013 TaxID=1262449 RepID=A0A0H3J5J5_CLOPA|nr:phosphatidylglycerol lysyltransferase domain-containing protein [Clostridium pasteurianum]AJA48724.1 acetyltransferase, including N-acetylases of ribosomal proteins [Clostridium pasteurianum DSM 525 = ATCC 6013]AJA52712.1 acetyltransferase, including N-acetylases of ribosomal proteins [Clostridium pasteurianum DSM 525 = ATCC 6013]AOZ75947.1 hypothetical protein AQ983_12910 [Clostridium pasteurianum DSM 525 = ATCC 6013]AOZ79743.1 hypothetical protein AQ984_12905 [Clostridium pasteurianum]ELP
MLQFKKLDLEDKELFDKYLKPFNFKSCEYSFTTLFIWKEACNIEYAVYDGVLILKKMDFNGKTHFMQPIGYDKNQLKEIFQVLDNYKIKNNMDYLFKDLECEFVEDLREYCPVEREIIEDRDNFDYIYPSNSLISLAGKKLHGKKNHYNQFVKNYDYYVKNIREVPIENCIESINKWLMHKGDVIDEYLKYEAQGIEAILKNKDKLEYNGIVVYVKDDIVGLTIGEKVNEEMAIIHIEKADPEIRGLYAFVNKTFVEQCFSDVQVINREQDLGKEGLRKAKQSYKPFEFVKKYIIQ